MLGSAMSGRSVFKATVDIKKVYWLKHKTALYSFEKLNLSLFSAAAVFLNQWWPSSGLRSSFTGSQAFFMLLKIRI